MLPAPYVMSILCRWLFPYLIRKCLKQGKWSLEAYIDDEEFEEALAAAESKRSFIKMIFSEGGENLIVFPYLKIISVVLRLSVLAQLVNFSLKLTQ